MLVLGGLIHVCAGRVNTCLCREDYYMFVLVGLIHVCAGTGMVDTCLC